MTHTYIIHGMTCNGCRGHVEEILSKVENVSKASVNLEKGEAVIEMEKHIPLEVFQKALEDDGGRYSISEKESPRHSGEEPENESPLRGLGDWHTYKIHGMTCNGCRSHVRRL